MNRTINAIQNAGSPNVPAKLVYNGELIHEWNEMLSLTDMWKAAGREPSLKTAEWLRSADAQRFCSFLRETLNVGNSHIELTRSFRGGRTPGLWAHWQIALAHAKYLSPEFHMWCITVVREKMEGKPVHHGEIVTGLDAEVCKTIGGIVKSVMRANLPELIGAFVEQAINSDPRRSALDVVSVRELLDEAKALQKGRNCINRKIGHELRTRALLKTPPVPLRLCPHSGVWLYPRDFAMAYMAESGLHLVKMHNDRVAGQGVFKLASRRDGAGEARP